MSQASEKMLDVMRRLAAVGTDVETNVPKISAYSWLLLLLFAMIRSVVKSFKVPDVEVAAARMNNESALTRMTDSTPKKPWSDLTLVLDG